MKVRVDLRQWAPTHDQIEALRRLDNSQQDWNDRDLIDHEAEGDLWIRDLICRCPYHDEMRLTLLGRALFEACVKEQPA